MKLIYGISDKPKFSKTLIFALQQMIAIMAATLLVPILISTYNVPLGMAPVTADPAAALFGAGIGTLVYIFFTKRRSPVFLGSSFTFLGAYSACIGQGYGYWGVILGIAFAGLVYVVIALIVKFTGSAWVNKLLPPVIIGPIVTLIGLSLSGTATSWTMQNGGNDYNWIAILCGLFTFLAIVFVSVKGTKNMKLIPFVIGIGAGYALALIFTVIGHIASVDYLKVLDFQPFVFNFVDNLSFQSFLDYPKFFFLKAIETNGQYPLDGAAIGNIAMIFVPIGIVELAQHISDHKNLSNIVEKDLITDPGLDKTLLGDGVGSMVGGVFGGCANTTYGESIGCVAITGNASIVSILTAAVGCMVLSFFTPFVVLINTIPKCVMGGACIALYGFIAVSGLQMLKRVDLGNNKNLFVVSAILVCGIGGLCFNFGENAITGGPLFSITSLAAALIVGIVTNLVVNNGHLSSGEESDGLSASSNSMGEAYDKEVEEKKDEE